MADIYDANGIYGQMNEVQQAYADTCAIKSQQLILNEFGIPCTEDELVRFSYEHGWYKGDNTGTLLPDVGNLLEEAGIPCTRQANANVFNLVSELSQGHKIIVGVDADELWNNDTLIGKFKNWFNDFFHGDTPNHALIVAGIDTTDPNNIQVIVTDPGNGDHMKAYPLDQFMDAWSDASCYMVSTDCAVPQSQPEMANFNPEIGHIDNVAGLDFSDFQIFNDMSYGIPTYHIFDDGNFYSPMASLVDGYFDVAHQDIMFNQLFNNSDYLFNDFLTQQTIADNILPQMGGTFDTGMSLINFTPDNDWNHYAMLNDISMFTNLDYANFLNQSIMDFQALGDMQSVMYCEQQHMMLDFCDHFGFSFYDSFMI